MKFQESFSKKMNLAQESATLQFNAKILELQKKKTPSPIINLTTGEPDLDPPFEAQQAIRDALLAHRSKYTPVAGIMPLREAIAEKTNHDHPASHWDASNVVVSNGGKQALWNAFFCILNPKDQVLIPSPFWLSYTSQVSLCSGTPKLMKTSFKDQYKLTPSVLENSITPATRMVIFNSPNNPTGAVYSESEWKAFGKILSKAPKVWIVLDEIYDKISFEGPALSFLRAVPDMKNRCIVINGLSKTGSMTGWRVGWSVTSSTLTQKMIALQSQCTSGINALAQYAALATLKLPSNHFEPTLQMYRRRRALVLKALEGLSKLEFHPPQGGFYFFLKLKSKKFSAETVAEMLLEEQKLALMPGASFGAPHSLRLSFATEDHILEEGLERLKLFFRKEL